MIRLMKYLVPIFLFLLPIQLGTYFFLDSSFINGIRTDYLAPALFLTDIVSLILIAWKWQAALKFMIRRPVLISLGLLLLPVVFASEHLIAIYRYAKLLQFVALIGIFQREKLGRNELIALGSSAALQLGLALLQLIQKSTIQGPFYWLGERAISVTTPDAAVAAIDGSMFLRPYGTFSHPNSLGGYFVLLYFFVVGYAPFKRYPRIRGLVLFLASLLVLISFSKVAIGTFVILNLLLFAQTITNLNCRWCGLSRVVVLLLVAFIFVIPQGDPLNLAKRIYLIDSAISIIIWKPLLGTGLGNYLYAQAQYPHPFSTYFLQPVHNIVLLFISEAGLLVGGTVLWLLGKNLQRCLASFPFFLCILAVILTGMMDHYWLTLQQNWVFLAVAMGSLYPHHQDSDRAIMQ